MSDGLKGERRGKKLKPMKSHICECYSHLHGQPSQQVDRH